MLSSVSVVLPCGYGDRYFRLALRCALEQTYTGPLEVVVLDNSADPIEHLLPKDVRIRYVRCGRETIGDLRNRGSDLSTGDVICGFDEDDWYSKDRIAAQVERLRISGRAVTGWHDLLFYNTADGACYRYKYAAPPPYAVGTSLCYTRAWWAAHPFQAISKGEDYYFQLQAAQAGQLDSTECGQYAVARAHHDSTSPPLFRCGGHFPPVERSALPPEFWAAHP
jgi:glycosyltransferase involved in cell wall biosynthesis